MILIFLIYFVVFRLFSIFMVFNLFLHLYDLIVIYFALFYEVKYLVIIKIVTPTITWRKVVDLKDSKHKCSSSSHDWKWHCTDEEKMIDEIIIPNIPSQYLREFRLHHEEDNSLRDLGKKLTDIIPEDEDDNRIVTRME